MTGSTQTIPRREESTGVRSGAAAIYEPLYNVVLLDDNAHTYDYVMEMMQTILGCPSSWAFEIAVEVDTTGRVVVDTTTYDEARLLQQRIHSYGADARMAECAGSMTAIIEPTYGL